MVDGNDWNSCRAGGSDVADGIPDHDGVTGIAALYKDTYGDVGFPVLKRWLLTQATRIAVTAPWGTPQLVAFTGYL